jgi:diadenosine tetraphosphate (Ap4A) HIT family hydrolase
MGKTCPFCQPSAAEIALRNELCYVRYDRYPVARGHLLIIPFRHVADFFDLTEQERSAVVELLWQAKAKLDSDVGPDGYNVGVNIGQPAGQTVMHVHIHIIPRYHGDMERPEGGVRGVIPEKRIYRKN